MSRNRLFLNKKPIQQPAPIPPVEMVDYPYVSDEEMIKAYDEILLKRNSSIRKIEKDMNEVKEMYQDAKALIQNQQPPMDTILKNIDSTKTIVKKGVEKNLQEAEEKQKSWCFIM